MLIKRMLMLGAVNLSVDSAAKVHFSNLAKEFSKQGFKVLCLVYSSGTKAIITGIENVEVKFVPNPLIGNLFFRVLKYLFLVPVILWQFLRFSPAVVYFRFSPPAFLYLLFLKLLKIFPFNFKIILEFNSWVPEERIVEGEGKIKVGFIRFLQLKSIILVDYVRVVTSGIKDKLNSFGVDCSKVVVIGNGTDIDYFKPIEKTDAKKKIGLDPDFLYVGFIGNFSIWQGLETFVPAIPIVAEDAKKVRFLLVGDGPEMSRIEEQVAPFKDKVILTGRVPYREANTYINAFDIGIAPFIEERNATIGLSPLKIRDYAACSVPIITTKIRGLEIIEKEGIGVLVPPNDSESLAEAIIKLSEDSRMRERMGKKGRKIAEERFSWKFVAKQILKMVKIWNEKA